MALKSSTKVSQKHEVDASPAYRKVVAELHTCEERYDGLVKSMGSIEDERLAAAIATLESEVRHRRSLEAELLTAVETERQRIGQDLHDHLCQELGAAAMMTNSVGKRISGTDRVLGRKVAEVAKLINRTIAGCRNLAHGLHPVTLAGDGLPSALEELAARIPLGIKFQFPKGERIALEHAIALHLYRIAEEAVANAIKHGSAKNITIELEVVADNPVLVIRDDGNGFAKNPRTKGMGLRNMHYRANVIGAELTVETGKGKGTIVSCRLGVAQEPVPR